MRPRVHRYGRFMIARRTVLAAGAGLTLGACGTASRADRDSLLAASATSTTTVDALAADTTSQEPIVIALTLHRLLDDGELGTMRTSGELDDIGQRINEIWAQANIVFEPLLVRDLVVPTAVLAPIVSNGNIDPLIDAFRSSIEISDPGVFNGFFLSSAFGVNGFAPSGVRAFFVVDEPTVHDERVTSHEIGHLLGLHHNADDPERLMFSGTNGTTLDSVEQVVARYIAQGVLDGQR